MSYIVKAHHYRNHEKRIFEGPLDVLLELIEKEKLDITEVSLAKVADHFFEYLKEAKDISPDSLADFLLVAGKLILIKSKAILPMLELEKEEEEDIEELKTRLIEYRRFKNIAKKLKNREGQKRILFSREGYIGVKTVFCPPEKISIFDLREYFGRVLDKLPKFENLTKETVKEVIISIKDKIEQLKNSLANRIEITFKEMTVGKVGKLEVIITFLAMLELVRRNFIIAEQLEAFGEIRIKRVENFDGKPLPN